MTNLFSHHSIYLSAPAAKIVPVTPDNNTDLPEGVCRALLIGMAGTANLIDASGARVERYPQIE